MFSINVLKEELQNSKSILKRLKKELNDKYSWGYSIKCISGNKYLYKMRRNKGKVIYKYCGKIDNKKINEILREKKEKKQLKQRIRSINAEIIFINKSLKKNGKRIQ